ncbi:hypothetical protein BDQ17DRAFT_1551144 [Cyathus striatus]|nr:hypothetical protein BDQ17DRAFT_1551144 [Cyathus striatus]
MLSYDATTGMIVLMEERHGVVVDVSLCVECSATWVGERLSKIIVIGHVEDAESPGGIGGDGGGVVEIERGVVVRAVMVVPAAELDLKLWNRVIEEGEGTPSGKGRSDGS